MAKKATKKKASSSQGKSSSSSTKKRSTKKKGRPQGSKTIERPSVENQISQCPKCGSTEKGTIGQGPIIQQHYGIHHGKAYTHIVRRRVVCHNCGQHRMDITHENRVKEIAASN